jgi:hypothetical protein
MGGGPAMMGRIVKALASIKLAVVIILALGVATAWGTIVEARYGDAVAAQKLVYHSVWMYALMLLLSLSLIAVMVDRWPWKKRHTGFILAHIGIIILILGSVVTRYWGVDGSLSFGIGDTSRQVLVSETDLTVYASLDGSSYRKVFDREVDFFLRPPTGSSPVEISLSDASLKVVDYYPYAFREQKIVESDEDNSAPAVRFQLQNPNVSVTDWLIQSGAGRGAVKDLGPAQVMLTSDPQADIQADLQGKNTIVLRPRGKEEVLDYEIHTASTPGKIQKGTVRPGETVETGWMGLVLRVLKYMPKAKEEITFRPTDAMTPLTTAALKVEFNGRPQWMSINSMLKLFTDQAVYIVTYANRRIDIGFDLELLDFRIGRYQGTMRAASYESLVKAPVIGEHLISMNEPLKFNGYTFYQASFQEDESGRTVASILSVNRDPGRWIKYLGSLLIVLGTIHLFYFKHQAAKAASSREVRAA